MAVSLTRSLFASTHERVSLAAKPGKVALGAAALAIALGAQGVLAAPLQQRISFAAAGDPNGVSGQVVYDLGLQLVTCLGNLCNFVQDGGHQITIADYQLGIELNDCRAAQQISPEKIETTLVCAEGRYVYFFAAANPLGVASGRLAYLGPNTVTGGQRTTPEGKIGLAPSVLETTAAIWAGGWDASRAYVEGDLVSFQGALWVALDLATVKPGEDGSIWQKVSSAGQGPRGPRGPAGAPGPAGPPGPPGAGGVDAEPLASLQGALAKLQEESASHGAQLAALQAQARALGDENAALRSELKQVAETSFGLATVAENDARLTQDPASYAAAVRALEAQLALAGAAQERALARGELAEASEWQSQLDDLSARLRSLRAAQR